MGLICHENKKEIYHMKGRKVSVVLNVNTDIMKRDIWKQKMRKVK